MHLKCYSLHEERRLRDADALVRRPIHTPGGTEQDARDKALWRGLKLEYAIKAAIKSIPIDEICDALDQVNLGNSEHTYRDADDIRQLAEYAEEQLQSSNVPERLRPGCAVEATSGKRADSMLKGSRVATRVTLIRGEAAWYITSIESASIPPAGPGKPKVHLTEAAREAVFVSAFEPFA